MEQSSIDWDSPSWGGIAFIAVDARREKRQRAFDRHVESVVTEGGDLL